VRIGFNSYADAVNVGAFAGDVFGPSWRPGDPTCATERNGFAATDDLEPGPGAWIGRDAGWACPGSTVEPLTSNGDHLKSAIDGLSANSMTAGHLGVAWAWYLIAPDWDDVWPSPSDPLAYSEPDSFKAVILMTDGAFNTEYAPALGTSRQQAEALCAEMRDAGVLVYAIAFQAPPAGEAVLENCAGDPDFFFSAEDGDDLVAAYDEIANQLSSLRIVE